MDRIMFFILLITCLLVMISCKDEEDTSEPQINIEIPVAGMNVIIPDTVDVKVLVTDDRVINSVTIAVVDAEYREVVQRKSYLPGNKDFTAETAFSLTDKNLETGTYYIKVTADDGSNINHEYRDINIQGIGQMLVGFIAITSQVGIQSEIFLLDPVYETDTHFILNDTYHLSAIHSNWEQFFFISDEPSSLTSYPVSHFEPEWEVGASPPRPEFTAVISDVELMFSSANGDVTIVDKNGNIRLRTSPYEDKSITQLASDENYIYAAHISLGGDIHELTVLYRVTGEIRDQKLIGGEIKGLIAFNGVVYIFLESGTDIAILLYNPETMEAGQVNMIFDDVILSAVNAGSQEIFLLTESAVISYIPYNNNHDYFTMEPYKLCRYDYLNDDVFLVKDKDVYRFDRLTGDLLSQKSFEDELLDFQVLYNK
jgi:hypothetical protein